MVIKKCPKKNCPTPNCGRKNITLVKIGDVITVKKGKRKRYKINDCGHTLYLEEEKLNDDKQ